MGLVQDLRLANLAACAMACCLLAPTAAIGQLLSFPKGDEIRTASGTLRRGAIIDLTTDQVIFQTVGETSPIRWPRESVTIVRWAGVTDAPQRVDQTREVFRVASSALGDLPRAPGADLAGIAQKVDDALSCLEVLRPVADSQFNNRNSVNEANALSEKLRTVAAELARMRSAQPHILRGLDLVQKAKAAIQKGGLASASAFLADARRCLEALEPAVRKRFGLESLAADVAVAGATLAELNGAVLEDRAVPKTLSDLEPLRDLVAESLRRMISGLPTCVAPAEWQEAVRKRLQTRAEAVSDALRQTEEIRKTVVNIERQLVILASQADTKADAWQPLATQVEADLADASNAKVAPDLAPLVLTTLADLRQRFERVKALCADRAMTGHISRVSETDARLLAAYQRLLAHLGGGVNQETLRSAGEAVAAIKKDLAAHEKDLRAIPDVKGVAADALQAIRGRAQETRQKVDRLQELVDLGEGIFKARAALEGAGEAVSTIGENAKRIQDRLAALRAEPDTAFASLVDSMADQSRQILQQVEYVAGCREAKRLQASIEAEISAGQLDEARAGQQKHRELVRRVQGLAVETGGADVSDFQSQQSRLAAQLDRAITARRKQVGWLEPFPTEPELVPPLMWNRWAVVWLAMGGGRGSDAEAALAAMEQSPESKQKEWAARLAEARAFICLRRGIQALDLRDIPEARRFFKEVMAEAPTSCAAKAAQVELVRLDDAEWRAASRQKQQQALLAAGGALAVLVPLVGAVVWSRRPPRRRRKAARLLAMAAAAVSQGNGRQVAVRVARAQRILKRLPTDTAEDADLRLKAARLLEVKPRDIRKEIRQRIDDSGDEAELVKRIVAGTSYRPDAVELCLEWWRKNAAPGSQGTAGPAVQVRNWLVAALAASPGEGAAGASWREQQADQAVEIVTTSPDLWLCLADNARALSHYEKAQTAYRSALLRCRDGDRGLRAVLGLARTFLDQGRPVEAARLLRGVQRKQLVLPDVPPVDATVLHDDLVRDHAMPEIRQWHGVAIGAALKDGRVQNPAAARAALPMLFPEEES